MRVAPILGLALVLATGGCSCGGRRAAGRDAGPPSAAATTAPPARPDRPVSVGTVRGRILLADGAELPRWTLEDIDRGPDRPQNPPECGPPRDVDTLPVTGVGTPTALVGILVTATGVTEPFFRALGEWGPHDRTVTIDACRLTPKLVSATVGDTLVITNHTDIPYLPTAGPSEYFEAVLQGQSRRVVLERGGLTWIKCGFSASCGRSEMVVLAHPVHGVTGADGRFELRNVPSDQAIQLHAWHPMFREASVATRVARNGETEVDITIAPLAPRPAAPTPPVPSQPAPINPDAVGPMADFPNGQIEVTPSPLPRDRLRQAPAPRRP